MSIKHTYSSSKTAHGSSRSSKCCSETVSHIWVELSGRMDDLAVWWVWRYNSKGKNKVWSCIVQHDEHSRWGVVYRLYKCPQSYPHNSESGDRVDGLHGTQGHHNAPLDNEQHEEELDHFDGTTIAIFAYTAEHKSWLNS